MTAAAFASLAMRAFTDAGYEPAPGVSVAQTDGSTLFVSGGIQGWRDWTGGGGPATRAGLQWCMRMNRLAEAGRDGFVTSFAMLTAARRGDAPRYRALAELFTALDRIGVDVNRTGFVVPIGADGRVADPIAVEALDRLGVGPRRIGYAQRRWAAPFGAAGPAGPNLFVLVDRTDRPCGPGCTPGCGCGRWFHFWNCEFLDARPATPVLDSAGGLERLWSAATGRDMFDGPMLYPMVAALNLPGCRETANIVADHARSLALLLAAGVVPAARGRGHVVRRLARRAGSLLVEAGADPGVLRAAVLAAEEHCRAVAGFGSLPAGASARLDAEITHCRHEAARSAALFHRWTRGLPAGSDVTGLAFRLRAERGVPLPLLRRWSARDGFTVDEVALDALLATERVSSRSPELEVRVAARLAGRTPANPPVPLRS